MKNPFKRQEPYAQFTGEIPKPGRVMENGKASEVAIMQSVRHVCSLLGISEAQLFVDVSSRKIVAVNADWSEEQTVFSADRIIVQVARRYNSLKLDPSTIAHLKFWFDQKINETSRQRAESIAMNPYNDQGETEEFNALNDENAEV